MGCSGGRHLPTTGPKLKILIFGVGGSSIRPLGTITGNDHAGIQIAPPIGDTRSAVEKGGAGSPFLACMRYFAWVHRRQGRKGMQG